MDGQPNIGTVVCPPTEESVLAEARQAFEELVCFCLGEERTFWEFEKRLLVLLFGLGRVLTRLMLVHRHVELNGDDRDRTANLLVANQAPFRKKRRPNTFRDKCLGHGPSAKAFSGFYRVFTRIIGIPRGSLPWQSFMP
jgi:hypothetical protein